MNVSLLLFQLTNGIIQGLIVALDIDVMNEAL
jgi:hypothetical protein